MISGVGGIHHEGINCIKQKLMEQSNQSTVDIKQLNGNCISLYFVQENSFWSSGLGSLIGNGYSFEMFDVLERESIRFHDRKMPKGNARKHKLGEDGCDHRTASGILGYHFFHKQKGESVLDPMHVIAAILEWSGIAHNRRGMIEFINPITHEMVCSQKLIMHFKNHLDIDIDFISVNYINEALTIAEYEAKLQDGSLTNYQNHLKSYPNQAIANIGDKVLKLFRGLSSYHRNHHASQIESDTQDSENNSFISKIAYRAEFLQYASIIINSESFPIIDNTSGEKYLSTLYEAVVGAIFLSLIQYEFDITRITAIIDKLYINRPYSLNT